MKNSIKLKSKQKHIINIWNELKTYPINKGKFLEYDAYLAEYFSDPQNEFMLEIFDPENFPVIGIGSANILLPKTALVVAKNKIATTMQDNFGENMGMKAAKQGMIDVWLECLKHDACLEQVDLEGRNTLMWGFYSQKTARKITDIASNHPESPKLKFILECANNPVVTSAKTITGSTSLLNLVEHEMHSASYDDYTLIRSLNIENVHAFYNKLRTTIKVSQSNQRYRDGNINQPNQE